MARVATTSRDFDDIILEDDCICCGAPHTARVRDVLRQPTYAGFDYEDGGQNGAVQCEGCTGMYVTGLCSGNAHLDSGKGHNHCLECPDFGECVGDYRNAHCRRCGDQHQKAAHYERSHDAHVGT